MAPRPRLKDKMAQENFTSEDSETSSTCGVSKENHDAILMQIAEANEIHIDNDEMLVTHVKT